MDGWRWESMLNLSIDTAKWCGDNYCGSCKAATACVSILALLWLVQE